MKFIPVAIILALASCSSPPAVPQPTEKQKAVAAEARYETDLLACAAFVNGGQIDQCATDVRTKWHRLPDGGKQ